MLALAIHLLVNTGARQRLDSGQTGHHGDRVARERTGLVHRAVRRQAIHDLAFSAEGPHREAASDDLAERGEVGRHTVELLRAAERHAESGDDLVEYQHHAVLVAERAQPLQKAITWRNDAHVAGDRLKDDRGDLIALCFESDRHSVKIVVRQHDRVGSITLGHARGRGDSQRHEAGARCNQQRIRVTVIVAVELDELVASGIAASQSDRAHGRLGAARDHAHHIHAGDHVADSLGELNLDLRRRSIARATVELLANPIEHLVGCVTQYHRAPRRHKIDVLVADGVPHVRALGVIVEDRIATHALERTDRRIHAARDIARCLSEEALGVSVVHVRVAPFKGACLSPRRVLMTGYTMAALANGASPGSRQAEAHHRMRRSSSRNCSRHRDCTSPRASLTSKEASSRRAINSSRRARTASESPLE
jgi:hypothetical protein